MKIANMYNHLNGYEYMLVHKKQLWEEIESAINSINADDFIKYSKDKAKLGKTLYDQKNINKQFRSILYPLNWKSVTIPYYVTGDIDTAKNVALIRDREEQKQIIEDNGLRHILPIIRCFVKDRLRLKYNLESILVLHMICM